MQVLLYHDLASNSINGFAKWRTLMEQDDLKSADIKKVGDNLYRARLNRNDRLLLTFYHYQGERYALVLEYLPKHNYAQSRFLRQVSEIDEDKIPSIEQLPTQLPALTYVNHQNKSFNLLDKIIIFDEKQQSIFTLPPPLVIIGAAGSGKTALILEKLKTVMGRVLYVTRSAYLVKHSRDLYYAQHYTNSIQQVDFLSFYEFLASIQVPSGKPITFSLFAQWFAQQPRLPIKDANKLFEEFNGVITGSSVQEAYLSEAAYLNLGIKQSIFLAAERPLVYELFKRYLNFLKDHQIYDSNLLSHHYLEQIQPRYDFVVVDEVQDLTTIQLFLILKVLHNPSRFLLCGDSHQIVHPNFFAWKHIKSLLYQQDILTKEAELIRVLQTNYRNSAAIAQLANQLLCLKTARFGALDRESTYLIKSNKQISGHVWLLPNNQQIRQEINIKTRASTQFAVIVLQEEQKLEAQRYFDTPLIFSIQEAKGLEYENIILYNVVSTEAERFTTICQDTQLVDLASALQYKRSKNKLDKSLEVYKFYINALYVALTRAVINLYWLETNTEHHLFTLLNLNQLASPLVLTPAQSSSEEWQREAQKLKLQGKHSQAERIKRDVLAQETPNWLVYTSEMLNQLYTQAIDQGDKKARLSLYDYALVYEDRQLLQALIKAEFKPALFPANGLRQLQQKYYLPFFAQQPMALRQQLTQYGVDFRNPFNQTPLMIAANLGKTHLVQELIERGANRQLVDNKGFTAFQNTLTQASYDERFAQQYLTQLYDYLAPDHLIIQLDSSLVKLDKYSMPFFLLNLMLSLCYRVLPRKLLSQTTFEANDLVEAVAYFPTDLLPPVSKTPEYMRSVLAQYDMTDDGCELRLLYQFSSGQYLFNPTLMLQIEGQWVNIYDLLPLNKLTYLPAGKLPWWKPLAEQEQLDQSLEAGRQYLQQQLQQIRMTLLNEALSLLQVLCGQELRKLQATSQRPMNSELPEGI